MFCHRPRAMSFFHKTFTNTYGLWRCTCEIFRLNFLTLKNIIFWHREHMHMGAELRGVLAPGSRWSRNLDRAWVVRGVRFLTTHCSGRSPLYVQRTAVNWTRGTWLRRLPGPTCTKSRVERWAEKIPTRWPELPRTADRAGVPWEGEICRSPANYENSPAWGASAARARWRRGVNRIQEDWELWISH
jgi:hypothetical protein